MDWWAGQDKARRSVVSPELSVGRTKETWCTIVGYRTCRALRSCPLSARGFGLCSIV